MARDLHPVAMEQRTRLGAQLDAVHEHDGVGIPPLDVGPGRSGNDDGTGAGVATWQADIGAVEGADGRFARRKRELMVQ